MLYAVKWKVGHHQTGMQERTRPAVRNACAARRVGTALGASVSSATILDSL